MEIKDGEFIFSDDTNLVDIKAVHHYLSTQSYWAKNIPFDTVKKAIKNSLCFGIYTNKQQIGFARWDWFYRDNDFEKLITPKETLYQPLP